MNKTMLIALLTVLLIVALFMFAQTKSLNVKTDLEQNSIAVSPTAIPTLMLIESTIPVPSETEKKQSGSTDFLTCDTDRDCALGAVCREARICPTTCPADAQGMAVDCPCTTVKKCEPK